MSQIVDSIRINELMLEMSQCTGCRLSESRRNVVVPRGTVPADILFLNSWPGHTEDLLGLGIAGKPEALLTRMLDRAGLKQYRWFMTYMVACRPSDGRGEPNRDPLPEEILACAGHVIELSDILRPKVVVFMDPAVKKYYHKTFPTAFQIQNLNLLLKTGGANSPFYLKNIRILEEVAEALEDSCQLFD